MIQNDGCLIPEYNDGHIFSQKIDQFEIQFGSLQEVPLKTLQSAQQSASTSIIDKEPPHVFSVGYNDKIQNIPCSHFLIIQFIT